MVLTLVSFHLCPPCQPLACLDCLSCIKIIFLLEFSRILVTGADRYTCHYGKPGKPAVLLLIFAASFYMSIAAKEKLNNSLCTGAVFSRIVDE